MTAPLIAAGVKLLAPVAKDMAVTAATQAVVAGVAHGVESAVKPSAKHAAKDALPTQEKPASRSL